MLLDITIIGLVMVGITIFLAPFIFHKVEKNLEIFFLIMGLIAATIAQVWHRELTLEAVIAPIKITAAVLIAGLIFHFFRNRLHILTRKLLTKIPLGIFSFSIVLVLGLASSLISAIIAALVLVEIVDAMRLSRKKETLLVVLACFSIGFGAALTPLGEPLSTIAISKLNADFLYLARLLGIYIFSGILILSFLSVFLLTRREAKDAAIYHAKVYENGIGHSFLRAIKVYIFVMALIILGAGFTPIIDTYFIKVPDWALYWVNLSSSVLDNATLTAAEIGPALTENQIKSALIALLIAGGILIPGNIPNIICASRLKITMKEWARIGIPLGMALMVAYFIILQAFT